MLSEFGEDAKWSAMFSTGLSLLGLQRKGGGFVCVFACHVSGRSFRLSGIWQGWREKLVNSCVHFGL